MDVRRLAWVVACSGLLLGLAASANASPEKDPAGEALIRAALDALHSPEADVRHAATSTLWNLRERAVGPLVARARGAKDGERDALAAMARLAPESVVMHIDALPAPEQEALAWLRQAVAPETPVDPRRLVTQHFGAEDPDVASQVLRLLHGLPADRWSSDHPALDKLAALGRPAAPSLLLHMAPPGQTVKDPGPGFGLARIEWAASALIRILGPEDVQGLTALVRAGWMHVVPVLARQPGEEARRCLLGAARRGPLTRELARALRGIDTPEALAMALDALRTARLPDTPAGEMDLLELAVQRQAAALIPIIHRWLDVDLESIGSSYVAKENLLRAQLLGVWAGIRMGDLRSLPVAIEGLGVTGPNQWMVAHLGEALDRVTGEDRWQGKGEAARTSYRAWWKAHRAKLVWDANARRFRVRDR